MHTAQYFKGPQQVMSEHPHLPAPSPSLERNSFSSLVLHTALKML